MRIETKNGAVGRSARGSIVVEYTDSASGLCMDLFRMIERSGFDVSKCRSCGQHVVCIPDGLPFCEECAKREDHA